MPNKWKAARHWLWISSLCAGCTAQSPLVAPASTPTMIEIYQRHAVPTVTPLNGAQQLAKGASSRGLPSSESKDANNPVIHMYVYPHRSKADDLQIPGYWTSFPLYERFDSQSDALTE